MRGNSAWRCHFGFAKGELCAEKGGKISKISISVNRAKILNSSVWMKKCLVTEIVLPLGFADVSFRVERSDDRKYVCVHRLISTCVRKKEGRRKERENITDSRLVSAAMLYCHYLFCLKRKIIMILLYWKFACTLVFMPGALKKQELNIYFKLRIITMILVYKRKINRKQSNLNRSNTKK